jgi:hypothetical protein
MYSQFINTILYSNKKNHDIYILYTLFAIKHIFITWFFTFCINHTKMVDPVLMLVVGWCGIWCENVTIITLIFSNGFLLRKYRNCPVYLIFILFCFRYKPLRYRFGIIWIYWDRHNNDYCPKTFCLIFVIVASFSGLSFFDCPFSVL